MRWLVLLLAVTLAGCTHLRALDDQPVLAAGTTVIAVAIVPGPEAGQCRAKVSRDPAQVRRNKPVVWEVFDLCSEGEQPREVEVRFTTGELRQHLTAVKGKGSVGKGRPDHLEWRVSRRAEKGQDAYYEIWAGGQKLDDPRIEVPR